MRPTQRDIARQLGVSVSLVSRALAGKAADIGVHPRTIERIRRKAEALGYVPSAAARQLRGTGQRVLGLVAADLGDPFFGPAMAELIRQCHGEGYALTLAGFERREPGLPDLNLLLQHHLDGVVVLGGGPLDGVKPFLDRRLPVVRIGSGPARAGVGEVTLDETMGMGLVVQHLLGLGHREIAFVGARVPVHERRLALVRTLLASHHLKVPPARAALADPDVLEAGTAGVEQLAARGAGIWPTAVICSSDAVALGVLRGIAKHGLRVPEHISVTGFDDLALARLSTPPLTSIRQPLAAMVADALRLIREGPAAKPSAPHPPALVARGSTTTAWSA